MLRYERCAHCWQSKHADGHTTIAARGLKSVLTSLLVCVVVVNCVCVTNIQKLALVASDVQESIEQGRDGAKDGAEKEKEEQNIDACCEWHRSCFHAISTTQRGSHAERGGSYVPKVQETVQPEEEV